MRKQGFTFIIQWFFPTFRIKTNGSLPREKRPGYGSPFDSPRSPSSGGSHQSQSQFSFSESPRQTSHGGVSYENVNLVQGVRNGRVEIVGNDHENGNDTITSYENIQVSPSLYGKIQQQSSRLISANSSQNYENFVPLNRNLDSSPGDDEGAVYSARNNAVQYNTSRNLRNNNNNNNPQMQLSQAKNGCEIIENKLAISNDDLLEAIEQLSMIAKSREAFATPKRNNSERDNAKSNEAKADKAREELEIEDRRKYVEFLQNEKLHIHGNMELLKRSIADIETQEEEINREVISPGISILGTIVCVNYYGYTIVYNNALRHFPYLKERGYEV